MAISGWAVPVIYINAEMENYEAGVYTKKVLEAITLLSEKVMPCFPEQVEATIETLCANVPQSFVGNEISRCKRIETHGKCDVDHLCCGFAERKPRRTRQGFSLNEEIS